jgi:hypothetical protein
MHLIDEGRIHFECITRGGSPLIEIRDRQEFRRSSRHLRHSPPAPIGVEYVPHLKHSVPFVSARTIRS